MKRSAPDCQTCGVCCFTNMPDYIRVMGSDYERLGDDAETLTWTSDNRVYLRVEHGRCIALEVDVAARRFACGIYDRRPAVCRELVPGSPFCAGELATKAERVRELLERA
jgi:uncharacterized protein